MLSVSGVGGFGQLAGMLSAGRIVRPKGSPRCGRSLHFGMAVKGSLRGGRVLGGLAVYGSQRAEPWGKIVSQQRSCVLPAHSRPSRKRPELAPSHSRIRIPALIAAPAICARHLRPVSAPLPLYPPIRTASRPNSQSRPATSEVISPQARRLLAHMFYLFLLQAGGSYSQE